MRIAASQDQPATRFATQRAVWQPIDGCFAPFVAVQLDLRQQIGFNRI